MINALAGARSGRRVGAWVGVGHLGTGWNEPEPEPEPTTTRTNQARTGTRSDQNQNQNQNWAEAANTGWNENQVSDGLRPSVGEMCLQTYFSDTWSQSVRHLVGVRSPIMKAEILVTGALDIQIPADSQPRIQRSRRHVRTLTRPITRTSTHARACDGGAVGVTG